MKPSRRQDARPRGASASGARALIALLGALALLPHGARAQQVDPVSALLDYMGIEARKLASLGEGPILVEIPVSDRKRQAALGGVIRLRGSGRNLFFGPEPGAPPSFIEPMAWGYFSYPAEVQDLSSLKLDPDDYAVLAECKPENCRFKLPAEGIGVARSIDWKSGEANQRFLAWFREFLVETVSSYRKDGIQGLPTYADKPEPFPVARGIARLGEEAGPVLRLYPAILKALGEAPSAAAGDEPLEPASGRVLWSVADFGYRPTLSVDRIIVRESPEHASLGGAMAIENLYSNHYLAGRLQIGGVLHGSPASGVSGDFFWLVDQILFDDKLGSIKRSLLSRGLKSDVSDRLKAIQKQGAARETAHSISETSEGVPLP
jgi:hypothetical protein